MGAMADVTHEDVANSFLRIYYEVAERMPSELPKLYGDDSELQHAGDFNATGRDAIEKMCANLPLVTGATPSLFSIDSQYLLSGGVNVLVNGVLGGRMFCQSFILEHKPNTHNLNFYLRNDIFRFLPEDPAACAKPYKNIPLSDYARRAVSEKPSSNPNSASPSTVVVDVPAPNKPVQPAAPPLSVDQPADNIAPVTTAVAPVATVAVPSQPPAENKIPAEPPATTQSVPVQTIATGNKDDVPVPAPEEPRATVSEPALKEAPPAEPAPPKGPISWASMVKSGARVNTATPAVPAPPPADLAAPPPKPAVPATVVAPAPAPAPAPPTTHSSVPSKSVPASQPASTPTAAPYNGRHTKPHDKPRHSGGGGPKSYGANGYTSQYKSGQRQFGPSCVVQLASVGPAWSGKNKELTEALRVEFSKYGHEVRHVEVKATRGIVFVEYDAIEGVEAAVEAWKTPRADGVFAGVKLSVTEKRNLRSRPQSNRGGRPTRGRRGSSRPTGSAGS